MADKTNTRTRNRPDDVAFCSCANLRKAARAVTQSFDAALAPAGLKATQFTVLATVERLGEAPMTHLAEALVMDRTTLTRNLKPLERAGWLRLSEGEDRRVRRIALTRAGRALLNRARPLWQAAQGRVVEGLGEDRWSGLIDGLAATVALTRNPQGGRARP